MKKLVRFLILGALLLSLTACTIDNPFKDDDDDYSRSRDRRTSSPSPSPSDNEKDPIDDEATPKPSVAPIEGVFNVGETVTVQGEPFYVLEASDDSMGTVTLIAMYNLDKNGNKQVPNGSKGDTDVEFCNEEYWVDKAETYYEKNGTESYKFCINDVKGYSSGDAIGKSKNWSSVKI